MPRKDFVDERISKKQRKLDKRAAEAERLHTEAEAEIEAALKQNRVDVEKILTPKKEKTE